jgi:hypothetical protein
MAKFDLSQYATVEERLRTFWADENNKDARIITINHTIDADTWIIETRLYLNASDQQNNLPKTTGWASERNTDPFSLERCETSSIGRCLANYIYSGSKRASREEMTKVAVQEWLDLAGNVTSIEQLRDIYTQARANNAPKEVLDRLKEYADHFAKSQASGTGRSVSDGKVEG